MFALSLLLLLGVVMSGESESESDGDMMAMFSSYDGESYDDIDNGYEAYDDSNSADSDEYANSDESSEDDDEYSFPAAHNSFNGYVMMHANSYFAMDYNHESTGAVSKGECFDTCARNNRRYCEWNDQLSPNNGASNHCYSAKTNWNGAKGSWNGANIYQRKYVYTLMYDNSYFAMDWTHMHHSPVSQGECFHLCAKNNKRYCEWNDRLSPDNGASHHCYSANDNWNGARGHWIGAKIFKAW